MNLTIETKDKIIALKHLEEAMESSILHRVNIQKLDVNGSYKIEIMESGEEPAI